MVDPLYSAYLFNYDYYFIKVSNKAFEEKNFLSLERWTLIVTVFDL